MNRLLRRLAPTLGAALALGGCSEGVQAPANGAVATRPAPDYQRGLYAYTDFCGGCHDAGTGGAPMLDGEHWNGAPHAYPALLEAHREKGWLRLPAKGAHAELNERSVADAVGYMLQDGAPR